MIACILHVIGITGFINSHNHFSGLFNLNVQILHTMLHTNLIRCVNINMHGVFHLFQRKIRTPSDNDTGLFFRQEFDDILLRFKDLILCIAGPFSKRKHHPCKRTYFDLFRCLLHFVHNRHRKVQLLCSLIHNIPVIIFNTKLFRHFFCDRTAHATKLSGDRNYIFTFSHISSSRSKLKDTFSDIS